MDGWRDGCLLMWGSEDGMEANEMHWRVVLMKGQEPVEVVAQFIPTTLHECEHLHNECKTHQHKQHRTEKSNTNTNKITRYHLYWIPQMRNTTDKYLNDTNTHKAYLYTLVTQPSKLRIKRQNHDPNRYTIESFLYEGYRTCMCHGMRCSQIHRGQMV